MTGNAPAVTCVARGMIDPAAVCRRGDTAVPKPINPRGPSPTRRGAVTGYPRLAYNVWRLIARACLSAFPEERATARRATVDDDPAGDTGHEPSDQQVLELGREIHEGPIEDIARRAWLRGARPRGF